MAEFAAIASMVASLAAAGTSAAGTIMGGSAEQQIARDEGRAKMQAAKAGNQMAKFEAGQLKMQGREELAASQQEMLQARRAKTLALSRLQSIAAGSGFTATDPTALDLASDIAGYGALQEGLELYGGLSRKEGLYDAAKARRFSGLSGLRVAGLETESLFSAGSSARTGSFLSGAGTILGGISTFADKYANFKKTPYG
jgi:hypothetical protein